ncbi:periplasmic solute binding protein [Stanieria sp. NIES-3757]|nr:periplasmic solute binding protein [Stanieria sp. NIES-3757]
MKKTLQVNLQVKSIYRAIILALAVGLGSCSKIDSQINAIAQEKPKVVASHSVLCDFAQTIAQDTIDLTCLIEPSQSAHTYRPTPSAKKAIEQAQLILYGGYEFEPSIIQLVKASTTTAPKIAVHEAAVTEPIMSEHHHEYEDEHHEEESHEHEHNETTQKKEELEPDPHIWHNVWNAVAMVELIQSQLISLNPTQADLYLQNGTALTEKLTDLNDWINQQIATIPQGQRILVTTHDSLNYYVQAYPLEEYKTLQGLSTEESPTASKLRDLVTEIRQANVPTIFAEVTANDKVITSIAREANVKISDQKLYTDSLGEAGTSTGTYIGMMENNTCAIAIGLGGKCKPFQP